MTNAPSPEPAGDPAKKSVRARKAVKKVAEAGGNAAEEVAAKARQATEDIRETLASQARDVTDGIAADADHLADGLDRIAAGQSDEAPTRAAVEHVAASGRQVADYLREKGPEGLIEDARRLVKRHPEAFVLGALFVGFLLGNRSRRSPDRE
jgi:hypothetical protein